MAAFVFGFALLLGMAYRSDASYCLCNSGVSDTVLQKNIDYACGAGADCSAILQNGACYNPNTVKDHCSYAVNSYYQRKGQVSGSCDFQGTAALSVSAPSGVPTGCVYPSSAGSTTPNIGTTGSLGPTSSGFGTDNNGAIAILNNTLALLLVCIFHLLYFLR